MRPNNTITDQEPVVTPEEDKVPAIGEYTFRRGRCGGCYGELPYRPR